MYFGTLRLRQLAPFLIKKSGSYPRTPLARILIHIITWKGKASIFYISLAFGGYCPPDPLPLLILDCVHFCTNVRIWINLREKYGTKVGVLLIYYPKNC